MNKNYRAVVMCSRHKDNKDIEGFKPRNRSFLVEETADMGRMLTKEFLSFVSKGKKEEMSRMYMSINRRDLSRARNKLIAHLALTDNWKNLDAALVGKAMEKDCDLDKRWLLDVDTKDSKEVEKVVNILKKTFAAGECSVGPTPNGLFIVAPRGFDTRELLEECPFIENKKDGSRLVMWTRNNEEAFKNLFL